MADNALMRHRRMQETQRAFAEQFNRETPQDYPVTERSSLLPLATYGNGQTGLAWPGMIAEDTPNALTAPARALRGEMPNYLDDRDAYLSEGLNFAGTAAVGGSVVPKPTNTAGVFGGNLPSGIKAKRSTNANGQTNYTLTDETAGAPVGTAYVRDLGDNVQVGRVSIADDYQRQGVGAALYGQIESDLGKKLVPDETLSPKAYSFWMKHHPERVGDYTPPSSPDGFYLKSREAGTGTGSGDPVALQALLDSIDDGKRTTLAANSRPSSFPGTLLSEAADQAPRVSNPIRAYHGSPHDFDKFDLSKIGTGEGAQAFGHGLYFAEREGVARSYRDALGGQKLKDGTPFDERNPAHWAADAINRANGDRVKAAALLEADMTPDMKIYEGGQYQRLLRAKGMIERGESVPEIGNGKMYEVSIHADPNDFLDWDKPLSQQSEKVQGALKKARPYLIEDGTGTGGGWTPWKSEGASKKLREAGIPGIRYLDQGSRTAGEGSRNYVVFDDALIEILRKYGLLGTLGAGAAASSFGAPPAEAAPVNALMRRQDP